jgi:hypothetical protein
MIHHATSRHRFVKRLCEAGIGVVVQAEVQQQSRFVSVEIPPLQVPNEPQALERFQREPLATSAFNQPNVNPGRGGSAWV